MFKRPLNKRELEILHMIRPSTWLDWVEVVRKDTEKNRFKIRRLTKQLT